MVGLAAGFVDLVADGHESAVDREPGVVDIEVAPAQAEQFTSTDPGVGREPQGGEQPVTSGRTQENPQLVGGPRLLLDSRDGPHLGRRSGERNVAADDPAAQCMVESSADDQVTS